MSKLACRAWTLALLCLAGAAAHAHHSGAMFDETKPRVVTGTVREFQWTNPHCYIQLVVDGPAGKPQEWSLEMGAPVYLYRLGWRPSTLKAGQKVTVRVFPLRNGKSGGLVQEVQDDAGHSIGARP